MAREEIKQVSESKSNGTQITLRDIVNIFWINRWWFVISVLICLILAVLYLKKTPKTYSRTASVLVKSQKGGGTGMSQSAVFQDMGVFGMMTSDVNNEFYVFKSYKLMADVVDRLNLSVNYTMQKGLQKINLYKLSPVEATFIDANPYNSFSIKAKVLNENEIQLDGFKNNESIKVRLSDTVDTPVGRVFIVPTDRINQYIGENFTISKNGYKQTVLNYLGKVTVSIADRQASVLNLTMRDVSEPRAEDVLNTLIDAYNAEALNDKNTISRSTDKFINDRLEVINEELGAVDADIASYKSASGLTDVTTETSGYAAEGSEYRRSGLAIENQLAIARQIQGYINTPSNRNQPLPSNLGLDPGIEAQISQYNNLLLQRNKLFASSSEKNPLVQDLDAQLIPLKQTIASSVNNLVSSLAIQAGNVRSREAMTRGRIAAIPRQQNNLFSKERQQKIKEELYLYLLNKREENALSLAMTESNIKVIDYAKGPLAPVAPRSMFIMIIALLIGLAIPALIFWLRDILDVSVRGRKDVEDAISAPFLGEIPRKADMEGRQIVVREDGRDSISEAFRIIRTNMDFMNVSNGQKQVVMFTSQTPGNGKTFVSTNLAVSFAQANKKIILIDTDIRKATLETLVKKEGESKIVNGLTTYLSGKIDDVSQIIHRGAFSSKLDVIFAGPIPPNPTELLMTDRLGILVNELKKSYDYIFLDNVPSGVVADASIVNKLCDLTIFVVRAGVMDRRLLPEVEKLYKEKSLNNLAWY